MLVIQQQKRLAYICVAQADAARKARRLVGDDAHNAAFGQVAIAGAEEIGEFLCRQGVDLKLHDAHRRCGETYGARRPRNAPDCNR